MTRAERERRAWRQVGVIMAAVALVGTAIVIGIDALVRIIA